MKKLLIASLAAAACATAFAQSGGVDEAAERARIARERAASARTGEKERAACYKKFVVASCLEDSRARERVSSDALRRQETELNDAAREKRTSQALQRREEGKKDPADVARQIEASHKAQQQRQADAAERAQQQAGKTNAAVENAARYERKQREFAENRARAAQRSGQSEAERQRYLRKREAAEQHRAEVEHRNATRDKPRQPGLPDPPVPAPASPAAIALEPQHVQTLPVSPAAALPPSTHAAPR